MRPRSSARWRRPNGDTWKMSKRKATNGNADGHLTPQQCVCVDLLCSGSTLTAAAEALGVGRPAVSDWVNHCPPFIAALNARRQELWDGQVETLRGLLPRALEVLKAEMDGPQLLQAAVQVLKSAGFVGAVGRPSGPTTAAAVEDAQRRQEIDRALTAVSLDDVQRAQRKREQERTMAELLL